ncbi:MBL fold metallo-hydrolase [Propionicimonas sp.]|uniref:MBL fold metallo-hydrolase n=1 Tax=Propionicimonas sp. TaxID=1955623 RepID=UPI0039E30313
MFLASFASGHWQANCYVVAAPGVPDCVVIDPGQDAAPSVRRLLSEHQLKPKGILATHGHFDHVANAAELADEFNIPLWIHSADRHLLAEPAAGLNADGVALLRQVLKQPMTEPARVEEFDDLAELSIARLRFGITPAPGHTAGSVLLGLDYNGRNPGINRIVFSGDVVFAGSIGRTDLPGGDARTMARTLRDVVLPLPDSVALLPGHGPQTTMAHERVANPHLAPASVGR